MSALVGNPEDRFSRVAAHINPTCFVAIMSPGVTMNELINHFQELDRNSLRTITLIDFLCRNQSTSLWLPQEKYLNSVQSEIVTK